MAWLRAALTLVAAGAVAAAAFSGGSSADPRTPAGLPGLPPPFLGTAVLGDGGLAAAVDAYGDVVDLRAPGPAGRALIDNPAGRQAAGTVPAGTGIVPRVRIGAGPSLPLWRADSVSQHYLPGTGVVRTVARFGRAEVAVTDAIAAEELARIVAVSGRTDGGAVPSLELHVENGLDCERQERPRRVTLVCVRAARRGRLGLHRGTRPAAIAAAPIGAGAARIVAAATSGARGWIARAEPLDPAAPAWARRMYRRSLLVLRALTDRRTGAVAAGARDGWAYVWPRDAAATALAFAAAGYHAEARRIARFLLGLHLGAAARFHGDGTPVAGREAQGDASGWVAVAARAAGLASSETRTGLASSPWRAHADYQEGDPGDYLANAIATAAIVEKPAGGPKSGPDQRKSARRRAVAGIAGAFGGPRGLARRAGDAGSGLDSAAAWAVRPFALPALFPAARGTLLRLAAAQTRFGIAPGESWPGTDPWTAPTAWTAWSLAALGERAAALRLFGDLRRAATPAGALPERVDAQTGIPRSTTPLAWSHGFAILALRQLWP